MKHTEKWIRIILWLLFFVLGGYIIYRGIGIASENGWFEKSSVVSSIYKGIEEMSVGTFMPGLSYSANQTSNGEHWLSDLFSESFPLYEYVNMQEGYEQNIESKSEYEMILAAEAAAEDNMVPRPKEEMPKDTGETIAAPESEVASAQAETESQTGAASPDSTDSVAADADVIKRSPVVEFPMDKLLDYDYVLNNFYAIDMTTTIDRERLDVNNLINEKMTLEQDNSKPQILIYHTHSQEAFVDSVPGDVSTTIVGIGEYLSNILRNKYGYNVIHNTGVYDLIDGELDRNKAYDLAFEEVSQVLADNPSIEVVIDLHRDGVDGKKMVTEIDGKPTAQIMFINGLSRTTQNGDITYLPNPYIPDNLAFAFQMKLKAMEYYPDFTRNNYLMAYRFNMHLRPKTLLVESGTQLSTVEEERNAMLPLADILHQVLSGE